MCIFFFAHENRIDERHKEQSYFFLVGGTANQTYFLLLANFSQYGGSMELVMVYMVFVMIDLSHLYIYLYTYIYICYCQSLTSLFQ